MLERPNIDIRPDHWEIVRSLLQKHVPQYEVWAFGSRAKWTAKDYSDLDLAVLTDQPMALSVSASLSDDFSESDLPWKVDVVDWATTSESFRKIIARDKVVVQSPGSRRGGLGLSSEWQNTTLGQICATQGGNIQTGPFGSQLHTSDYKEVGVPVVMPTNIGDGGIVQDGIARIDQTDVDRLSQHKLQMGDIVFSRRGDVTKNALIREHEVGWLCGTGCLKVRLGNQSIAAAEFISYCLRLPDIKDWLIRHAVGATMPNLNTGILSAVPIFLPPLSVQLEISDLLGTLDDRINLLRETNATLEAIAQALFKSWFVDFDPVRARMEGRAPEGMDEATAALFPDSFEESELGLVPKGWRVDTIESISERVGMGPFGSNIKVDTFVPLGIPVISGQHLKQTLVEDNTFNFVTEEHAARLSKSCVQHGDVIFTHAGSIGQVSMLHAASRFQRYVLSQRQFFLRCNLQVIRPEWAIYFFRSPVGQHLILANASQVGVPSIARPVTYLRSIKIVVPPLPVTQEFAQTVDAIHHRVMANRHQLQTLTTLRDTLLPRLISGQLRLPEAQSTVLEASLA